MSRPTETTTWATDATAIVAGSVWHRARATGVAADRFWGAAWGSGRIVAVDPTAGTRVSLGMA